jgi:large subunit ribosomal protein L23
MHLYEILKRPLTTEKTSFQSAQMRQYAFEVSPEANKLQIKEAVEKIFKVKVVSVNVLKVPGKPRRWGRHETHTTAWKKAIVKLVEGDSISFFEGV